MVTPVYCIVIMNQNAGLAAAATAASKGSGGGLTCSRPASVVGPDGETSTRWGDETCWGHIRPTSQKD